MPPNSRNRPKRDTPKRDTPKRDTPGWDALANWYDGWVGAEGSDHHRKLAIPAVLDLLQLKSGERLLDVGAGQGVLAPYIVEAGAKYTGIEISPKLVTIARKRHAQAGTFVQGDARAIASNPELSRERFDAAVFLLSIQDMNPLEEVLRAASSVLRDGARLVILMTHPCFRIPRQSGWGHDAGRDLRYRRIDRYLSPLSVPMKQYGDVSRGGGRQRNQPRGRQVDRQRDGQRGARRSDSQSVPPSREGVSISFHRPLSHYINGLVACGLLVDAMREIASHQTGATEAESRAIAEIPLFLGLRAVKLG